MADTTPKTFEKTSADAGAPTDADQILTGGQHSPRHQTNIRLKSAGGSVSVVLRYWRKSATWDEWCKSVASETFTTSSASFVYFSLDPVHIGRDDSAVTVESLTAGATVGVEHYRSALQGK